MTSTTGASAVTYFSFSKIGPKLTAQCPRDCSAQKWEHRPNSDGVFVRGAQLLCWCQRPLPWFGVAQGALQGPCTVAGSSARRWNATFELCKMQGELLPCAPQLLHTCSNCAGYPMQFQRSCPSIPQFNGQLQISQSYSRVLWVMHMLYAQCHYQAGPNTRVMCPFGLQPLVGRPDPILDDSYGHIRG